MINSGESDFFLKSGTPEIKNNSLLLLLFRSLVSMYMLLWYGLVNLHLIKDWINWKEFFNHVIN